MLCGKIASGKTTYANRLCKELNAVILSEDEIKLAIFGSNYHHEHPKLFVKYSNAITDWLIRKSVELVKSGINVIIDSGFWGKANRVKTKTFFKEQNIKCEQHFLDISKQNRLKNIRKRNEEIKDGKLDSYLINEKSGLNCFFETPTDDEVDVRIKD